eukprot:CAMPEP_0185850440 /NCGR_PEP_ID=MMETSP1354-20130828/4580_1 /TAXON_ID=708628 /ORGANISM="Erythrolobus madagascarensis, Strain CCMP3276" /LENGTH=51 /DNA_ID=CAMNT_0028551121 /DNA_START=128 /DNA_END=283 /DNA_ORIENTATION=-
MKGTPDDFRDFRELNGGLPPRMINADSPLLGGNRAAVDLDEIRNVPGASPQ